MRDSGGVNFSLKFILVSGIFVFVLMYVLSASLKGALKPSSSERVIAKPHYTSVDGERAHADVVQLCAIGPRISGSEGAAKARAYIRGELEKTTLTVEEQHFAKEGGGEGVNLLAKVPGPKDGVLLLLGHYDTLAVPGAEHLGANTGGAGAALLLELARAFKEERKGRSIWLVFLDGHYSQPAPGEEGAVVNAGAEAFAEWCAKHAQVDAVLSMEGLGDCYLRVGMDKETPGWTKEILVNLSKRLGYERHLFDSGFSPASPAAVFRERGVPAGHLQDFSYGGSPIEHKQRWHTAEDTPQRVCPQSLQAVGQLLYDALVTMDKRLEHMAGQG